MLSLFFKYGFIKQRINKTSIQPSFKGFGANEKEPFALYPAIVAFEFCWWKFQRR